LSSKSRAILTTNLINRSYEPTIASAGELGIDMPTTKMALRFVLSNPNVSTACSGMNTIEMLDENVSTVKEFDPEKDADFEQMCQGLDKMRKMRKRMPQ
jgi:predicted aldo/keto reductase-like oxidoreductase